jgi:hypothetical protein
MAAAYTALILALLLSSLLSLPVAAGAGDAACADSALYPPLSSIGDASSALAPWRWTTARRQHRRGRFGAEEAARRFTLPKRN